MKILAHAYFFRDFFVKMFSCPGIADWHIFCICWWFVGFARAVRAYVQLPNAWENLHFLETRIGQESLAGV